METADACSFTVTHAWTEYAVRAEPGNSRFGYRQRTTVTVTFCNAVAFHSSQECKWKWERQGSPNASRTDRHFDLATLRVTSVGPAGVQVIIHLLLVSQRRSVWSMFLCFWMNC